MKKRLAWKNFRWICLLLIPGLLFGKVRTSVGASNVDSLRQSIAQKQNQISDAQKEKKQLESGKTNLEKMKKELETQKHSLENYVSSLDADMEEIQQRIDELNTMISEKEAEIEVTEEELDQAIATQNAQYEAMKMRIKFMYEKGDDYYMEMISGASSFSDMLNRFDYIQSLSDYDSNKLQEYALTRQYVEACKEELLSQKELLDQAHVEVEAEEASLEALITEKRGEIGAFQNDINNKSAAIAEYEAYINEQNTIIAALEAAVAEEKRKLAAETKRRTYDGGMFAFPAPSYTRISDDYGNRMHPTLGIQKFHNGIDLAAPNGSPILAAYDGEVVAADYSSTMGKYIMIDHGDGLYTIYMHASALNVSKGASVGKGQQIGAVGSTGRSTGPHLHFSVRYGGNYVSPWNYLG